VPHRRDSFIRAIGATREALIAAFCRRDQSLSHWRETRFLERAMGIEPTSEAWEALNTSIPFTVSISI
jgi:hypothetical protein